jgi:hypothetical protein
MLNTVLSLLEIIASNNSTRFYFYKFNTQKYNTLLILGCKEDL